MQFLFPPLHYYPQDIHLLQCRMQNVNNFTLLWKNTISDNTLFEIFMKIIYRFSHFCRLKYM